MRKVVRNNESEGKTGEGGSKDSGVGQRQTATAARLAVARAPLFPPGSLFLFLLILPPPPLFQKREREAHIVGFIVFELDASLFCFVSRAIRGANCRSYAIAFCFLLLPPFLHDPLSVVSALRFTTTITTSLFFCSTHPDRHHRPRCQPRRKAESQSSLSPLARSTTLEYSRTYALPLVAPDFLRSDAENLSFRPLSFPREKRSVFVSRPPLHLSRSRPDRARLVLSILSSVT